MIALTLAGSLMGCMTMDSFFFNGTPVTSYALGGDIIPPEDVEQVTFTTDDGWTDYGVWAHQPDPNAPVFVYFHGNADNIDHYWLNNDDPTKPGRVEFYWQMGFNTFIFDYRGYGMTGGDPTYTTLQTDGDSAAEYVMSATGLTSDQLYYHALSLGGVPALKAAADYPPKAMSTEDVFANISMIVNDASDLDLPPGWFVQDDWDNAAAAADVHVPILIMHGDSDTYINPYSAELIYAQANDPRVIWHPPGCDHDTTPDIDPTEYIAHLNGWISGADWPS